MVEVLGARFWNSLGRVLVLGGQLQVLEVSIVQLFLATNVLEFTTLVGNDCIDYCPLEELFWMD